MSRENHIAALKRRHRELEIKLQKELSYPSLDEDKISRLKKQKLEIKDMLAKEESSAA